MLVLTQKADDKIHIGNDITVTILRVKGRAVKVGIEAPTDVQVLRDTLLEARALVLRDHLPRVPHVRHRAAVQRPR
jgi:carbon storage regulator CsrA